MAQGQRVRGGDASAHRRRRGWRPAASASAPGAPRRRVGTPLRAARACHLPRQPPPRPVSSPSLLPARSSLARLVSQRVRAEACVCVCVSLAQKCVCVVCVYACVRACRLPSTLLWLLCHLRYPMHVPPPDPSPCAARASWPVPRATLPPRTAIRSMRAPSPPVPRGRGLYTTAANWMTSLSSFRGCAGCPCSLTRAPGAVAVGRRLPARWRGNGKHRRSCRRLTDTGGAGVSIGYQKAWRVRVWGPVKGQGRRGRCCVPRKGALLRVFCNFRGLLFCYSFKASTPVGRRS